MNRLRREIAEAKARDVGTLPLPGKPWIPPERAVRIGSVPMELRGYYFLIVELKVKVKDECHRRCVALLESETYDNEHVEFQVYCQVTGDPAFGGDGTVAAEFCKELELIFPQLKGTQRSIHKIIINEIWDIYSLGMTPNLRLDDATYPLLKT